MKRILLSIILSLVCFVSNAQDISWYNNTVKMLQKDVSERTSYSKIKEIRSRDCVGQRVNDSFKSEVKQVVTFVNISGYEYRYEFDYQNKVVGLIFVCDAFADSPYSKGLTGALFLEALINNGYSYLTTAAGTSTLYNTKKRMGVRYNGRDGIITLEFFHDNTHWKLVEQKEKEIEQATRNRRFTIDNVLSLRTAAKNDKKLYENMNEVDFDTYIKNQKDIHSCVEESLRGNIKEDCVIHVRDSVFLSYDGEASHNLLIESPSNSVLITNELQEKLYADISSLVLTPAQTPMPATDTVYAVNSFAVFNVEYRLETKEHTIELKRTMLNGVVSCIGGEKQYYTANQKYIDLWFADVYGKYTINVIEKFINGKSVQYNVSLCIGDKKDKNVEVTDKSKIIEAKFEGKEAKSFMGWLSRRISGNLYEYNVGKVNFWMKIDGKGKVSHVVVTYKSEHVRSELKESIIAEITNSSDKWTPAKYDGKPVPMSFSFTYTFNEQ